MGVCSQPARRPHIWQDKYFSYTTDFFTDFLRNTEHSLPPEAAADPWEDKPRKKNQFLVELFIAHVNTSFQGVTLQKDESEVKERPVSLWGRLKRRTFWPLFKDLTRISADVSETLCKMIRVCKTARKRRFLLMFALNPGNDGSSYSPLNPNRCLLIWNMCRRRLTDRGLPVSRRCLSSCQKKKL